MYQSHKVYITEDMIFSELVLENPTLLLMLEFFGVDDAINDKTVKDICECYTIHLSTFLMFANLYNGFRPNSKDVNMETVDVRNIIKFLKSTHQAYRGEKYPKIQNLIKDLYVRQDAKEVERLEFFFNDYFDEVLEHLKYEEEYAFPYFCQLIGDVSQSVNVNFSVNEYRDHHSDIGTKLSDLKNLLIKHITLKGDFPLKRQIINHLFDLENDLAIHSMIEELVLQPVIQAYEKQRDNG